jgi:hypothetical protein
MSNLALVLLIVLTMLLIGALPGWPHAAAVWGGGYSVPGVLLLVVIIILALALTGKL